MRRTLSGLVTSRWRPCTRTTSCSSRVCIKGPKPRPAPSRARHDFCETCFRAVLLVSEDLDEILELAVRVAVRSGGTISHASPVTQNDRATIGRYMAGH